MRKIKTLPWWSYLGIILNLSFLSILWLEIKPISYVSFFFIWFGFILFIDGLNYRLHGSSLMTRSIKNFVLLFLISSFFWWFFEFFVYSTQNWFYVTTLDTNTGFSQIVASIFFATVIPDFLEVVEFLIGVDILNKNRIKLPLLPKITFIIFFLLGFVSLFLTFFWPHIFFPLMWLSIFFILDPINYWIGEDSLIHDATKGNWYRILLLSSAALICGFFWELWNEFADPSWYYSVPYIGDFKIFEMPIFGFLGYIPFGWEIFVFYTFFKKLLGSPDDSYTIVSRSLNSLERFKNDGYRYMRSKKIKMSGVLIAIVILIITNITFVYIEKTFFTKEYVYAEISNDVLLSDVNVSKVFIGDTVKCKYAFIQSYCLITTDGHLFSLVDNEGEYIRSELMPVYAIGTITPKSNNIGIDTLSVELLISRE